MRAGRLRSRSRRRRRSRTASPASGSACHRARRPCAAAPYDPPFRRTRRRRSDKASSVGCMNLKGVRMSVEGRPRRYRARVPSARVARKPRETGCRVDVDWEVREAGPRDAEHTVLLLPGGMCSAGSYAEVMAEPALVKMRLVAATLPGHAGTPPPEDYSIENYVRLAAEVATDVGADVVVG